MVANALWIRKAHLLCVRGNRVRLTPGGLLTEAMDLVSGGIVGRREVITDGTRQRQEGDHVSPAATVAVPVRNTYGQTRA
jgi:hypothetical protein